MLIYILVQITAKHFIVLPFFTVFLYTFQFMCHRIQVYLSDRWNIVDIFALLIFMLGEGVRYVHVDAARVILAFDLVLFYCRVLHIFSVHKELGPKLVMIRRMVKTLCYIYHSTIEYSIIFVLISQLSLWL